jgi:hypothetical protein
MNHANVKRRSTNRSSQRIAAGHTTANLGVGAAVQPSLGRPTISSEGGNQRGTLRQQRDRPFKTLVTRRFGGCEAGTKRDRSSRRENASVVSQKKSCTWAGALVPCGPCEYDVIANR